mmetsp:Transcript_60744/g.156534  ORF Transcript_60744/g.156534 Transcript_60744/m.156534 type:complete len:260 (-) Transcript_60744:246-1025(-)
MATSVVTITAPMVTCGLKRSTPMHMRATMPMPSSSTNATIPDQSMRSLSGCSQDLTSYRGVSLATMICEMGSTMATKTSSTPKHVRHICAECGSLSEASLGSASVAAALSAGLLCRSITAMVCATSLCRASNRRPMDLCAAVRSSVAPDSSRSTFRYHSATAWRTCTTVADCTVAPRRIAMACTCSASSSETGCESLSVSSISFMRCVVGSGPAPTLYRVKAEPTERGMCLKAYHVRSAWSTSSAPTQLSRLTSATATM